MSGGPPTVANSPRVPCSPPSFPEMETDYHYDVFFAEAPLAPPGMNYEGRYRIAEAQPTFAPSDDAPLANSLLAVLAQPAEALDDETSPKGCQMEAVQPAVLSGNLVLTTDGRHAGLLNATVQMTGAPLTDIATSPTHDKTPGAIADSLFTETAWEQPPLGQTDDELCPRAGGTY
eukprot:gene6793-8115_t